MEAFIVLKELKMILEKQRILPLLSFLFVRSYV